MRQAGRYLPEYRAARAEYSSFTDLLQHPEATTELVLQPLRRYELDAAILFSDILTIPDAMGLGLYFAEGKGPLFERPLTGPADVEQLKPVDPEKSLPHVLKAVRETYRALDNRVPLIGFAGSPWTTFIYTVARPLDGSGQPIGDRVEAARQFAARHPEATRHVLDLLAQSVTQLLLAQHRAGAQVLMLFDSWGGALGEDFGSLSLPWLRQVCDSLQQTGAPLIVYVRGDVSGWLKELATLGCHCLGLDDQMNLGQARQVVGAQMALQGNLSPDLLTTSEDEVIAAVRAVIEDYGPGVPGHIFNLGRGITPEASPELVEVMVQAVARVSSSH